MTSALTITRRSVFDYISELVLEMKLKASRSILGCCCKLLEYFRVWREYKEKSNLSAWVYRPLKAIVDDCIEYSLYTIRNSINLLLDLGLIDRRSNPFNGQDRVLQYRMPDETALMLEGLKTDSGFKFSKFDPESGESRITSWRSESTPGNSVSERSYIRNKEYLTKNLDKTLTNSREQEKKEMTETRDSDAPSSPLSARLEESQDLGQPKQSLVKVDPFLQARDFDAANEERHPTLVWAGEETPWLEKPSRVDLRFKRTRFNRAFLEWGGKRFMQKFGKSDLHEAIGDFEAHLQKHPEKVLLRWDEYGGVMGDTLKNVVQRAESGGTLDDRDRETLEKNRRVLESLPEQPQVFLNESRALPQNSEPLALPEVIEVSQEQHEEGFDWEALGERTNRKIDEGIYSEPVAAGDGAEPEEPSTQVTNEVKYTTVAEFQKKIGELMKGFGFPSPKKSTALQNKERLVDTPQEELSESEPASVNRGGDSDLVSIAIKYQDPIYLNDSFVKGQLLKMEALGMISLKMEGTRIVGTEDGLGF